MKLEYRVEIRDSFGRVIPNGEFLTSGGSAQPLAKETAEDMHTLETGKNRGLKTATTSDLGLLWSNQTLGMEKPFPRPLLSLPSTRF
jgi:hypothetical protein